VTSANDSSKGEPIVFQPETAKLFLRNVVGIRIAPSLIFLLEQREANLVVNDCFSLRVIHNTVAESRVNSEVHLGSLGQALVDRGHRDVGNVVVLVCARNEGDIGGSVDHLLDISAIQPRSHVVHCTRAVGRNFVSEGCAFAATVGGQNGVVLFEALIDGVCLIVLASRNQKIVGIVVCTWIHGNILRNGKVPLLLEVGLQSGVRILATNEASAGVADEETLQGADELLIARVKNGFSECREITSSI